MVDMRRRGFFGTIAIGAAGFAAVGANAETQADIQDGHAAGHDANPFANGPAVLPRKPGDAPAFTASLDRASLKAASGGWAREITARQLPIATGIAVAHLFLNPGASREMHWHNSAEWAYVIEGGAQVTIVDPDGTTEVFNVGAGDLWYFPRGYAHAIQTIGSAPCHAILAFDDGLYSEHGTFGISDVMSRVEAAALAQSLGVDPSFFAGLPKGETYIMQGHVVAADSQEAMAERPRQPARSRRFRLLAAAPAVASPGGTIQVASAVEFPASTAMAGLLIRLQPGAMQELHWHPDTNEMLYVIGGRARVTMFGPDKHLAIAEIGAGDCAYIPRNAGHMIQVLGPDAAEIIAVHDAGIVSTATLSDWMAQAPSHLLANNIGLDPSHRPDFRSGQQIAAAAN
jgi:oxalate decarboxylase